MDLQHRIKIFRLADTLITLMAIFLLLDAMFGFMRYRETVATQPRAIVQNTGSTDLSASCTGGFTNQRTVHGATQVAPRGTPFNAYQMTFTNTGSARVTIYGVTVDLAGHDGIIFAEKQATGLGKDAGITLAAGQSRQLVETAGVNHAVASCEVLSWQSLPLTGSRGSAIPEDPAPVREAAGAR